MYFAAVEYDWTWTSRVELDRHKYAGRPWRLGLELRVSHLQELGMNHAGEIAELAGICRPTVRLITNVGPVHLEAVRRESLIFVKR